MEQITSALLEAGISILIAIIGVAATFATIYLNKLRNKAVAEISKIETEDTQNYVTSVLNRVYELLSVSIDKMEVTLVKELKATTADGKLTKEDQARVANSAYSLFLSIANEQLIDALGDVVEDTETYIYSLIDSIVLEKKNELLKAGVTTDSTTISSLND